jgi:Cyclic nucleotide-binding domain
VTTRDRIQAWLDIRPGEGRSTSLMLLHSFFTGTSTVFFETAASALFLAHYDATLLPFVYLAAAMVSILTGLGYTRVKEQVAFAPLMLGTLSVMLAMTGALRLGLSFGQAGWLLFSMMIAYRLLSMLTDLEFWAVAARLYDVQQSKRLFGFVGSGEVSARVVGAFSVPFLVRALGVANLLWLSAAGLVVCLLLLTMVLRDCQEVMNRGVEDVPPSRVAGGRPLRSLFQSPYLRSIFVLAFFAVLGKYFVDFAFLSQMQTRSREVENLASFFGVFSGVTQIVNLGIRVLISGRLLNRFGILVGLLVLPTAHFLCTLAIVSALGIPLPGAVFWLVIGNQALYKTLKHPVDNPSFKVLYQPLPRRERLAAQICVEVIVTPIAIALAAALMLAFSHPSMTAHDPFHFIMLANFAGWSVAAFFAFREYGRALVRALEKRTLDRTSFSLEDERSIALVRAKLASERADEVIFALDLLQRIEHPSLTGHFQELLSHPSADVRFYVLLQIEKRHPPGIASSVSRVVAEDPSPRVQAVALRALAALGDPTGRVSCYLGHPDREVERGALIGLMQEREGRHRKSTRDRIVALARSKSPEDRVLAARVVGETAIDDRELLGGLLVDEDREVTRAAIRAVGQKCDAQLLERLVDQLADSRFRADAARALVGAGTLAAEPLAQALLDPDRPHALHIRIVRLVSRLDGFERHDALWGAYENGRGQIRVEALSALSALGHRATDGETQVILGRIEQEVKEASFKLGILRDVNGRDGIGAFIESLREEIDQCRDRVFLLLSFVYDRKTLLSARDHLDSTSREKRAYAAEILEVTLSQELKELTLALLDHATPEERLERLERRFPQPSRDELESFSRILTSADGTIRNWTRACAIYGVAKLRMKGMAPVLSGLRSDPNPLIAETALWASSLDESRSNNGSLPMLTIEKVLLLKGVPMFSATSEDTLADVAGVLEEVELHAGELVFSKGDLGNSMYIVVSGRVRVFDGDKTINYVGEREIFGELALLDPEPRSASVEAFEETRLFRLDRDTLFELMTDNIGVVSGIVQVLCRRLRRMTTIATGEKR